MIKINERKLGKVILKSNKWKNYNKIEKFVKNELFFNYQKQISNHNTLSFNDFLQEIMLSIFSKVKDKYLDPIHYGYLKTTIKNTINDKYNFYQFVKKSKSNKKEPIKISHKEFNEKYYFKNEIIGENKIEQYFLLAIPFKEVKILQKHSEGLKTKESFKLIKKLKEQKWNNYQ